VSIEGRRGFLLVKEETHAAIRAGILDWRDRGTPIPDRARSGELGCPPRVAQTENTWLAFLGYAATPYILSVLAIAELIADKLLKTPSRKAALGFVTRLVTGALCGAAFGLADHSLMACLLAGIAGGVAGTLGGYEFRKRLVIAIGGNDLPIALLEDVIAIGGAFLIVTR